MTQLYNLAIAYHEILRLIDEGDDNDWGPALAALTDDIGTKAYNIAGLIRSLEADAEAFERETTRLADKAKARRNHVIRLKQYLQDNLQACGLEKLKAGVFSLAIQASPPSCTILDEALVPRQFKVRVPATWTIDRRKIIEAWRTGAKQVRGCVVQQGQYLRIR